MRQLPKLQAARLPGNQKTIGSLAAIGQKVKILPKKLIYAILYLLK